jgi:hypothetical protein
MASVRIAEGISWRPLSPHVSQVPAVMEKTPLQGREIEPYTTPLQKVCPCNDLKGISSDLSSSSLCSAPSTAAFRPGLHLSHAPVACSTWDSLLVRRKTSSSPGTAMPVSPRGHIHLPTLANSGSPLSNAYAALIPKPFRHFIDLNIT